MSRPSPNDWFHLEVGGRRVVTTRATLTAQPSSALARMFGAEAGLPPAFCKVGSQTDALLLAPYFYIYIYYFFIHLFVP